MSCRGRPQRDRDSWRKFSQVFPPLILLFTSHSRSCTAPSCPQGVLRRRVKQCDGNGKFFLNLCRIWVESACDSSPGSSRPSLCRCRLEPDEWAAHTMHAGSLVTMETFGSGSTMLLFHCRVTKRGDGEEKEEEEKALFRTDPLKWRIF